MADRFFNELNSDENTLKPEEFIKSTVSGFWSEKIYVITKDYEIKGYVFMPKTGKKNRVLSDILNGKRRFVAIKDAEITCRENSERKIEINNFIQLNLDSTFLIRPCPQK